MKNPPSNGYDDDLQEETAKRGNTLDYYNEDLSLQSVSRLFQDKDGADDPLGRRLSPGGDDDFADDDDGYVIIENSELNNNSNG